MNTCLVCGQHLQDVVDEPGEIVGDRDGGLVLAKRRVLQISLIDGREQQRRVGKELLSIFAREYRRGTGDSHDKVRRGTIGVGGTDEVDDRLFRRADKPCRTHDDLNDVHRPPGALVQVDPEVAGEVVEDHVAAIERLQQAGPVGPAAQLRPAPMRGSASRSARSHTGANAIWRHGFRHSRTPRALSSAMSGIIADNAQGRCVVHGKMP